MAEIPPLNVKVNIDASGVSTGVAKATAGLEQISAKAKVTTAGFGKFKELALGVFGGNILTQGIYGVTRVLEGMREEVIAAQVETSRLMATLDNMTGVTEENKAAVEENVAAYASLGFNDAESINAMGTLLTATNDITQANKLMAMSADFARYRHVDLGTAARILARGTQGSAKAFKEMGITLDTTIPKNKAIAKAFDELNQKIGGQAQAYTKTFAGQMAVLKEKFDQVAIAVGTYLLPIFAKLAGWIGALVNWIQQNQAALKVLAGLVAAITVIMYGWAAVIAIVNALFLANPIGLWIVTIAALSVAFVALWNHFKIFRDSVAEGLATIIGLFGYLMGGIAKILGVLSRLPGGGFLKGVAKDADNAAVSIGKVAKSVNDLKNQKLTAPKFPKIEGAVTPGGKTGIVGNIVGGDTTGGGGGTGTVQYVTVYASNTNDIAKKLSKAAKNGTPIGGGN